MKLKYMIDGDTITDLDLRSPEHSDDLAQVVVATGPLPEDRDLWYSEDAGGYATFVITDAGGLQIDGPASKQIRVYSPVGYLWAEGHAKKTGHGVRLLA